MIEKRYRKVERKTGLAFIAISLLWLIAAFVFPMYRIIDFIILAVLSLITFVVVDRFAPKRIEEVEITDEPMITGIPTADEMLRVGSLFMDELKESAEQIKERSIKDKIETIIDLFTKILAQIKNDPRDATTIKQFMNFYLPTISKLLKYYLTFEKQGIKGENIATSMSKIEELLDNAILAFKKALDGMFADEAMDITTDIVSMETMLASRGLNKELFKF